MMWHTLTDDTIYDTLYDTILIRTGKRKNAFLMNIKKIIEKMYNQPGVIRSDESDKVLQHYGFRPVRRRRSLRHYLHGSGELITMKVNVPLKKVYVIGIRKRIGESIPCSQNILYLVHKEEYKYAGEY